MLLPFEYSGHSAFTAFHSVITLLNPQCKRDNVITIKMSPTFHEDRHALTQNNILLQMLSNLLNNWFQFQTAFIKFPSTCYRYTSGQETNTDCNNRG